MVYPLLHAGKGIKKDALFFIEDLVSHTIAAIHKYLKFFKWRLTWGNKYYTFNALYWKWI